MADIFHTFTINASPEKVFEGISTAEGLDNWWTKSSSGNPEPGAVYTLNFGSGYIWKAMVTKYKANEEFELQLTDATEDWLKTKVGFLLHDKDGKTQVEFYHTGWAEYSEHCKISSYCWAMYLRILKLYLESGEQVAYEQRLSV